MCSISHSRGFNEPSVVEIKFHDFNLQKNLQKSSSFLELVFLPSAREGTCNIFTDVCQSVHKGVGHFWYQVPSRGTVSGAGRVRYPGVVYLWASVPPPPPTPTTCGGHCRGDISGDFTTRHSDPIRSRKKFCLDQMTCVKMEY